MTAIPTLQAYFPPVRDHAAVVPIRLALVHRARTLPSRTRPDHTRRVLVLALVPAPTRAAAAAVLTLPEVAVEATVAARAEAVVRAPDDIAGEAERARHRILLTRPGRDPDHDPTRAQSHQGDAPSRGPVHARVQGRCHARLTPPNRAPPDLVRSRWMRDPNATAVLRPGRSILVQNRMLRDRALLLREPLDAASDRLRIHDLHHLQDRNERERSRRVRLFHTSSMSSN